MQNVGREEYRLEMDLATRQKICVGIARGLAFLHEESTLRIVHRDIKSTNVLLDRDLNPKISDFGLAKLDEEGKTHISTRVAGTMYATSFHLSFSLDLLVTFLFGLPIY
jgi:serine/threonine protein kinase